MRTHSYAYALLGQHLNESLLSHQVFEDELGLEHVNITFVPEGVGIVALEAIYGP